MKWLFHEMVDKSIMLAKLSYNSMYCQTRTKKLKFTLIKYFCTRNLKKDWIQLDKNRTWIKLINKQGHFVLIFNHIESWMIHQWNSLNIFRLLRKYKTQCKNINLINQSDLLFSTKRQKRKPVHIDQMTLMWTFCEILFE